jgi:electron transport complex protein RnfG
VDAITASTITSRAFLQAVNNAYAAYSGQQVDGASGATQQVSATVEKDTTACSGTLCKEGQTCDAKCDSCKVACGEKCDSVNCKKANCANVDCKKAECPNKDCKNKK